MSFLANSYVQILTSFRFYPFQTSFIYIPIKKIESIYPTFESILYIYRYRTIIRSDI